MLRNVSISERIFIEPLNVNPYFADFNVDGLDPQIKEGPTETRLIELVHEGRCGRKQALFEFALVMYHTLREETFEGFRRCHRPVENSFLEWFYEKLYQFIRILLFDNLHVTASWRASWLLSRNHHRDFVKKMQDVARLGIRPI